MTGDKVWVLWIDHRHGINIGVHATEAGALDGLAGFVDFWWHAELGVDADKPPTIDEAAIIHYFGHVADETWSIESAVVQRDGPDLRTPDERWADDATQFPRLLDEIVAVGLTDEQLAGLCESMDLEPERINELFDRAQAAWDAQKERLPTGAHNGGERRHQ